MRIGELARATGESVKTLRYWEERALLDAERSESGYRHFLDTMIDRVGFIRQAQALGFTLGEIREIVALHSEGVRPCDEVRDALEAHLESVRTRIASLRSLERELSRRLTWAERHPDVDCDDGCVYLSSQPA